MDAASARALHTQAQGIATQLRLLEPGEPLRRAPLLLQLAETAAQLRAAVASLTDETTRNIWQQRHSWLREELATLAATPAAAAPSHTDAALVVSVLDVCTRACRAARTDAEAALHQARSAAAPPDSTTAPSPRGQVHMLRTELVMAQQDLARRAADSSQLSQDVVALTKAHADAAARADSLAAELASLQEDNDRQADVIAHIMTRSEEWCASAFEASKLASALATENAALHAAVAAQAATLERLIALNAELVDGANAAAAGREAGKASPQAAPAEAAPDGSLPPSPQPSAPGRRRRLLALAWNAAAYMTGRDAESQARRAAALGRTPEPV